MLLVLVAGPVTTLWHRLSTPHTRCPEHGELLHEEASARKGNALPDIAISQTKDEDHAHEACVLYALTSERATAEPCCATAPGPLVFEPHGFAPPDLLRAWRAYRFAPKQSPPFVLFS